MGAANIFMLTIVALSHQQALAKIPCPPNASYTESALKKLATSKQPDRGILWRISKGDRVHYLYGTVHVAKIEWDFPGPTIRDALNESKVLAVELDITAPDFSARWISSSSRQIRSTGSVSGADSSAEIDRVAEEACLDAKYLAQFDDSSKLDFIELTAARAEGFYPDYSIDSALLGYSRATGKRIVELETIDEQTSGLKSGYTSTSARLHDIQTGEAKARLLKFVNAWASSDFDSFSNFYAWCGCSERDHLTLLVRRNAVLARRIEALLDQSDPVFVAIGVLHMIGDSSVAIALRNAGYTVTMVVPSKP